jgi:ribosome-associated protein
MIQVTPTIKIDESEIQFDFIRASGPGGQNVNKVASAVQLRFNVLNSPSLQPDVKERLLKLAGRKMTADGILIIQARRYRTQEQNRFDATQRLANLIQKALVKPKIRRLTHPGVTAKAARLGEKKQRGAIKLTRRYNAEEWED